MGGATSVHDQIIHSTSSFLPWHFSSAHIIESDLDIVIKGEAVIGLGRGTINTVTTSKSLGVIAGR